MNRTGDGLGATPPDNEPSVPIRVPRLPRNTLFYNENRLRAGWRFVAYVFTVLFLYLLLSLVVTNIAHALSLPLDSPYIVFLEEVLLFLIVFLPACVMARVERRSVGDYGLPLHVPLARRFSQGCALGIIEIAVLMGSITVFGGYTFGSLNLHGPEILKWSVYWGLFFVVVGLFEEFTFRGYLQFTLADGIGFWPAAWILSLGFGAVHLGNKGEGWVGSAGVVMIGLIFALALKRTGNLWFVVGWHAAFDFGETFLFSVPNSGNVFEGHLSNASLHGPIWLTGGTVGPEGSVFSFVTMAAVALFIHKAFPARSGEFGSAGISTPPVTSQ